MMNIEFDAYTWNGLQNHIKLCPKSERNKIHIFGVYECKLVKRIVWFMCPVDVVNQINGRMRKTSIINSKRLRAKNTLEWLLNNSIRNANNKQFNAHSMRPIKLTMHKAVKSTCYHKSKIEKKWHQKEDEK